LFGRCAGCLAETAVNKIGPGLAGVFGRPAGTAPNFHYSKAMIDYAKRWDEQTLDS
jgi:cytochrome c